MTKCCVPAVRLGTLSGLVRLQDVGSRWISASCLSGETSNRLVQSNLTSRATSDTVLQLRRQHANVLQCNASVGDKAKAAVTALSASESVARDSCAPKRRAPQATDTRTVHRRTIADASLGVDSSHQALHCNTHRQALCHTAESAGKRSGLRAC